MHLVVDVCVANVLSNKIAVKNEMMLTHTDPRNMSNSIELFFANHYVVPLISEPIFEMDSNAFSVVNPPAVKGWEQNFESFRDHKNFPLVGRRELTKTYHELTLSSFKMNVASSVKIRHHFLGTGKAIAIRQKRQHVQYYIHNGILPKRILTPFPYIQHLT